MMREEARGGAGGGRETGTARPSGFPRSHSEAAGKSQAPPPTSPGPLRAGRGLLAGECELSPLVWAHLHLDPA